MYMGSLLFSLRLEFPDRPNYEYIQPVPRVIPQRGATTGYSPQSTPQRGGGYGGIPPF
jgi:hypothetical protein